MKKLSRILMMMLVLSIGTGLTSCDEIEAIFDNPVELTHTVRINEFKITGPSTADIGQVLVFGVDKKAWCLVTVDAESYSITGTQADIPEAVRPYIDVIWTSSNPEVATVDANGTVTAIAPGQTTIQITVKAKDGSISKSASYGLTVNAPAPDPAPDPDPDPDPEPEPEPEPESVSDTTDGSGSIYDNDDYTVGGNPF